VKELLHAAGLLIIEGYGLTECSPTLTLNRPDAFRFDTVGKALPSVELRLAEDGEILARGPNVFRGYHKDPEATARGLHRRRVVSRPATWGASPTTASCRSSTARRTSS
jgi:long-subunit acyl-CoA synthetase (AMP-forming)